MREIIGEIREVEDGLLVSYRMGWGEDATDDVAIARGLEHAGADILHVSTGIPEGRDDAHELSFPDFGTTVQVAGTVRGSVGIPVVAVQGIRSLGRGNELIGAKACDFVAYGHPFLADPSFARRGMLDSSYSPCLGCRKCQWFSDGRKCPARIIEARRSAGQQ